MISVLIVDDEEIERTSMSLILSKAFPKLEIKLAKNGKSAIEIANSFQPDLILMDIKMPGMNGLEAIKQIKQSQERTKFIMVTAYDTFAYAKEAIKLGATDYILKPSKVTEITATIGQVIEQIEAEQKEADARQLELINYERSKRVLETDMVTQLLFDHVHDVHVDMLMEMLNVSKTRESFVFVVLLPEGLESKYPALLRKIKQIDNVWVGALSGRHFPVIVFRNEQSFRAQAIAIVRQALPPADQQLEPGWSIGIGQVHQLMDEIKRSYQQGLIAGLDQTRANQYRFYEDLSLGQNSCDQLLEKYRTKDFFDHVRLGRWEEIQQRLTLLIQCFQKEDYPIQVVQQRMLEMVWLIGRILDEMDIKMTWASVTFQSQSYQQLSRELGLYLSQLKGNHARYIQSMERDSMHQIKHYIMQFSHEDISLDLLADKMGLSPIYISKMFKEKLGINYIEFLTECRIEKAKQLLADPEKSIKAITFDIGYHDPNYFSKVFKRQTGLSPKQYRVQIGLLG
ncbi:two-component system, response regulator YesN [Amphibacillus marinus]|uniref:Two-component system, response regulator YesN n=1 Tax=Amphibacillus marinus TaxID=872970 RepID=A0A1H8L6J2_9BACI|nr:response regulator [Amphibacillus marinus]SEO00318.1 two-component system, response regulator YesN [Amphibacillus marinus]